MLIIEIFNIIEVYFNELVKQSRKSIFKVKYCSHI